MLWGQKTPLNISKVSCGSYHTLFQKYNGEIFLAVIQFICGGHHSLFLDSEGNAYSVGNNCYGQLGLGHDKDQNILNQILNIPPIQTILVLVLVVI